MSDKFDLGWLFFNRGKAFISLTDEAINIPKSKQVSRPSFAWSEKHPRLKAFLVQLDWVDINKPLKTTVIANFRTNLT